MFIGREEQFKQLRDLWRKAVASLVTCRGRRRIGKSTLIEEFASRNNVRFLKLEGLPPRKGVTNETQLEVFARQLAEQTQTPYEPLTNWFDAFARLVEVGGFISENLTGLEAAGFVAKDEGVNPQNGKRSSLVRYRISDNYTRFYLKYIEPNRGLIKKGAYNFVSVEQLPGWSVILGLQFESLVCNNLVGVLRELDLDRTLLLSAAPYRQGETKRSKSCQIDLLLQTRPTVYVIEIERRNNIGEEVVAEVREKMSRLKVKRGLSVIPILVFEGHASARIAADGFFARMIPAEDLLED